MLETEVFSLYNFVDFCKKNNVRKFTISNEELLWGNLMPRAEGNTYRLTFDTIDYSLAPWRLMFKREENGDVYIYEQAKEIEVPFKSQYNKDFTVKLSRHKNYPDVYITCSL